MPQAVLALEEIPADHAEMARQMVLEAWPAIVNGLIKKAMAGGHQQAKFLLDMCDLAEMEAYQIDEQRRQQLCDVLLDGLKLSNGLTEGAASASSGYEEIGRKPRQ